MTIIYLINHSTSQLFNEVWIWDLFFPGLSEMGDTHNIQPEEQD